MAQQFPESDQPGTGGSDWGERRQRQRMGAPWVAGAVLIVLGLVFLAQNMGLFVLRNWWALFILIPAFGSFASAWAIYQHNNGRFSNAARGPLMGGLILLMVAAAFLFNLNWSLVGPMLLILVGVGALITAFLRD